MERGAFRADQFQLAANVDAHVRTGEEMWEQSGGTIDVFVDFLGSGSTFTGIATALRRVRPEARCHPVEPRGAAVLSGAQVTDASHRIQGGATVACVACDSGLKYLSTDLWA